MTAKAGADTIEILLLGDVTVLRGGEPLPLPASKKTRALLGFLVATAREHSRERLCELLWDGPDDPRGGLRWALSKLRPVLEHGGARRLRSDRERVVFEAVGVDVDLQFVRALAARGLPEASLEDLRSAASRFRGRFLQGLDLPDCVHFYTWCVAEREQARAMQLAILNALIQRLRSAPERALEFARALVAVDPLAEASHLRVIELLAEAGRVREALDEYERCRQILSAELGARPSAELEKLRLSLTGRRARPEPVPVPTPGHAPDDLAPGVAPPAGLQLVGRALERALIAEVMGRSAEARSPELLLFAGDPGVGKSRLLEELGGRVRELGGRVLAGRAFEAELVRPYGPWIDALRSTRLDEDAAELRAELALLLPELGASGPSGDRLLLFDAIGRLVRLLAARAPRLALLIDDLQWLDEGSAALLHYLARAVTGPRVIIACTARAGELADNAAALRVVRALEREQRLRHTAVAPLARDEVAALVRQIDPDADAGKVSDESGGNPLFALELARAGRAGEPGVPESLGRLMAERLERLDAEAQAVLPWAAALGRSFDVDVLACVTGLPGATLLTALALLERHAVVRASGQAGYDFAHDLLRQAAYAQMSEPRRRLVHAQIARALQAIPDPEGLQAGDLLHHAALAGDHELAARACITAGRRCIRVFAFDDAGAIARRGLEHAEHLHERVRLPLQVELLGLRAQRPGGDRDDEIGARLVAVAREAERAGLSDVVARACDHHALVRYWAQDGASAHDIALRRAQTGRAGGSSGVVHLVGGARCLAHLERDMAKVAECLAEAVHLLGPAPDLVDFVWARGLLRRYRGDYAQSVVDLERVAAAHRREGRHWELCQSIRDLILTELEQARPQAALDRTEELADLAARMGEGVEVPAAAALRALAHLLLGAGTAWPALDGALADIRAVDAKVMLATCANFAAEIALGAKLAARARGYADEALAAATAVSHRSQAAVAHATIIRVAAEEGHREAVMAGLTVVEQEAQPGWAISARAQAAVERARAEISRLGVGPGASAPSRSST